ncbi:MAG: hypothetical protein AB8G26_06720 [Ilumatobacter sp.]
MIRAGVAVVRRPSLWPTAVRQMRRTAPPGWWRQRPFLPLPSGEYLRFRLLTQYGDADHRWEPDDVVAYLGWCRSWDESAETPS